MKKLSILAVILATSCGVKEASQASSTRDKERRFECLNARLSIKGFLLPTNTLRRVALVEGEDAWIQKPWYIAKSVKLPNTHFAVTETFAALEEPSFVYELSASDEDQPDLHSPVETYLALPRNAYSVRPNVAFTTQVRHYDIHVEQPVENIRCVLLD